MSQAESAYTASQAAAEIHKLINERPTLPYRHELEAIIAKVQPRTSQEFLGGASEPRGLCWDDNLQADRDRWRHLCIEFDKALGRFSAAEEAAFARHATNAERTNDPAVVAAVEAKDAIAAEMAEFEQAIWDRPVRAISDIEFLANIVVNQIWPGRSLTENFNGDEDRPAWTLEKAIENGQECGGEACEQGFGALLIAIRDLLSRKADEPGDAELLPKVRTAIALHDAAERKANAQVSDDPVLCAQARARWDELGCVLGQIPNPPRSALQVLLIAELAAHTADHDQDETTLSNLVSVDMHERSSARLIEACLAFLGGQRL